MRSLSLEEGTNLQETIDSACQTLLSRIPLTEGIRLIGVTASNLGAPLSIPSLFSDKEEKRARAAKAMDSIQQKYGRKAPEGILAGKIDSGLARVAFPPLIARERGSAGSIVSKGSKGLVRRIKIRSAAEF